MSRDHASQSLADLSSLATRLQPSDKLSVLANTASSWRKSLQELLRRCNSQLGQQSPIINCPMRLS